MSDDPHDGDHKDDDDDDADETRPSQILRTHGVTKIYQPRPGGLVTKRRITVEDGDGFDVRLVIEHDTDFGGEDTAIPIEDEELIMLLRALELVAKRRGLIQALRIVGPDT